MRATLEETSVEYRGVILTSETDEERQILRNIWTGKGRPASIGKLHDGNIELVVAPTPDEADGD